MTSGSGRQTRVRVGLALSWSMCCGQPEGAAGSERELPAWEVEPRHAASGRGFKFSCMVLPVMSGCSKDSDADAMACSMSHSLSLEFEAGIRVDQTLVAG